MFCGLELSNAVWFHNNESCGLIFCDIYLQVCTLLSSAHCSCLYHESYGTLVVSIVAKVFTLSVDDAFV